MVKIKKYLTLLLAVAVLALFAGCKEAPVQEEKITYQISLTSQDGAPLSKVKVFVYEDPSLAELVSVGTTDANGCVSFIEDPKDAFVAILKDVPVGFDVEEFYTISLGNNQITLLQRALTEEELASVHYGLGDQISNLSVTDCDGNRHNIGELLKQKKAVVLNFWYLNCNPCKMEFPYVQQAYEAYGNSVAFLALNPVDGTDETVSNFRYEQGLRFPVVSCNPVLQSAFQISAFPTTLIVDRTGTVCLIHEGMFTDADGLCNALEYFTQDDYVQQLFETIEEVPVM